MLGAAHSTFTDPPLGDLDRGIQADEQEARDPSQIPKGTQPLELPKKMCWGPKVGPGLPATQ